MRAGCVETRARTRGLALVLVLALDPALVLVLVLVLGHLVAWRELVVMLLLPLDVKIEHIS